MEVTAQLTAIFKKSKGMTLNSDLNVDQLIFLIGQLANILEENTGEDQYKILKTIAATNEEIKKKA